MAKKQVKNKIPSKKYTKYTIKDGKVEKGPYCPKCGPGVFLAVHKDRKTCGACGYSVVNK